MAKTIELKLNLMSPQSVGRMFVAIVKAGANNAVSIARAKNRRQGCEELGLLETFLDRGGGGGGECESITSGSTSTTRGCALNNLSDSAAVHSVMDLCHTKVAIDNLCDLKRYCNSARLVGPCCL